MTRDAERRARDPMLWHQVRARLARIKMAMAVKQVDALMVDARPNLIEETLLKQARKEVRDVRIR